METNKNIDWKELKFMMFGKQIEGVIPVIIDSNNKIISEKDYLKKFGKKSAKKLITSNNKLSIRLDSIGGDV